MRLLSFIKVHIGHGHEGYNGGLPPDSMAPYYATADTEVIFHVSTRLENNKWKHIGNDEVIACGITINVLRLS